MGGAILGGAALSLFRFHLSSFPPETPDTQATISENINLILTKGSKADFTVGNIYIFY